MLFPCNFEVVASESARPEKLPGGIRKVGTKQDCCHSNEKDECCTGVQWNTRWSVDSEVGMVESLRRGKGEERERERYGRRIMGKKVGEVRERCDENCIHVPGWFPRWCWR